MDLFNNPNVIKKWLLDFDNSVVDFLELLLEKWANPNPITLSLCGIDTEQSWILRRRLNEKNVDSDLLLISLSWLDSDESWRWRLWFLNAKKNVRNFLMSLRGVDSERAWEWRDKLLEEGARGATVLMSLAGVDSKKSWEYRNKYFIDYENYVEPSRSKWDKPFKLSDWGEKNYHVIRLGDYIQSLYALDSEQSRKWREKIAELEIEKHYADEKEGDLWNAYLTDSINLYQTIELESLLASTVGIDSERAWKFRIKYNIWGSYDEWLLQSLASINTEKAWQIRDENTFYKSFWNSLAGINSRKSWEIRNELLEEYCKINEHKLKKNIIPEWELITDLDRNIGHLAYSLCWNYETFLWRLNKKLTEEEIICLLEK